MGFTRTFHAIGQGAFYIEIHKDNNKEFVVVYDCGSSSLGGKKLEKKIKSSLPKRSVINLLVISHFHADHINGLEILKKNYEIEKVILPAISKEAETLLLIADYCDGGNNAKFITEPKNFFSLETEVITVEEVNSQEEGSEVELGDSQVIADLRHSNSIPSGKVLKMNSVYDIWSFIPFNYKHSTRKEEFVKHLNKVGLALSDIETIEQIANYREIVKKAYEAIEGDLNENSLILFSGKKEANQIKCYQRNLIPYSISNVESGCLYLGDIDLSCKGVIHDIKKRLRKLFPFIGTVQIPHHGSIHNFKNLFYGNSNIKCAVLSFGANNTYGHPSNWVISETLIHGAHPFQITEDQLTTLVQWD